VGLIWSFVSRVAAFAALTVLMASSVVALSPVKAREMGASKQQ
jgi:hypothetical protein